jgi:outer membrane protein assembly factor BamE (lipoprotein component of BamABCDE complex)
MKKIFFCLSAFAFLMSCSSGGDKQQNENENTADTIATTETEKSDKKGSWDDVYAGMPAEQVIEMLGHPSNVDTLNPSPESPIQDWWYSSNKKIRMMNGKVNRVVKDVGKENEIIKKIVEAKKNNDEKELKRLEEVLINQSY